MAFRNAQMIMISLMSLNLLFTLVILMSRRQTQESQCAWASPSRTRSDPEYYTPEVIATKKSQDEKLSELPNQSTFIPSRNGTSVSGDVRIFCWIMTMPANLATKAWAVHNTWAQRCNKFIFVSSQPSKDTSLPLLILNVKEDRRHLTTKTMQAFHHIYQHHIHEADWFLKADDDTYVIMENLRHFLSDKNPNQAVHYGGKISNVPWSGHLRHGYNAGGPGYVLSKEAVRLLGDEGIKNPNICPMDGTTEDVDIGFCLEKLGVKIGHTDDRYDRLRFHNFDPVNHLVKMNQYSAQEPLKREYPFSDDAISFHYVEPASMYMYDYLLYHLRKRNIVQKNISNERTSH